jgi:hypothetical protein
VIAGAGIRTMLAKRAFLGLLLISLLPFFARAVQIYLASNLPQAAFLAPTPEMFRQFLEQQEIWVFFITVYVGAGSIAGRLPRITAATYGEPPGGTRPPLPSGQQLSERLRSARMRTSSSSASRRSSICWAPTMTGSACREIARRMAVHPPPRRGCSGRSPRRV